MGVIVRGSTGSAARALNITSGRGSTDPGERRCRPAGADGTSASGSVSGSGGGSGCARGAAAVAVSAAPWPAIIGSAGWTINGSGPGASAAREDSGSVAESQAGGFWAGGGKRRPGSRPQASTPVGPGPGGFYISTNGWPARRLRRRGAAAVERRGVEERLPDLRQLQQLRAVGRRWRRGGCGGQGASAAPAAEAASRRVDHPADCRLRELHAAWAAWSGSNGGWAELAATPDWEPATRKGLAVRWNLRRRSRGGRRHRR
jgi:hypothetical protein